MDLKDKIYTIRGKQVMLDRVLAELYEVETKALNQAVKRNKERFPDNFCFKLTEEEFRSFLGGDSSLKSQFVTSKSRGGRRYYPYALHLPEIPTDRSEISQTFKNLLSCYGLFLNIFPSHIFSIIDELLDITKLTHQ
ncbi:MAG: ORF6N domain-containing protein [Candidatus Woesearchaeota archaeon]